MTRKDLRRRPHAEHWGEPLPLRADAAFDDLPPLCQDTDLAFFLVYVDANMLHGWPPPCAAHDRVHHGGASATTPVAATRASASERTTNTNTT